jgi:hypothetical protein
LSNQGFSSVVPLRQPKKTPRKGALFLAGGEGGIRTLGAL